MFENTKAFCDSFLELGVPGFDLCKAGYEDQILSSHDALFINEFEAEPKICEQPRFTYYFDYILPQLLKPLSVKLMVQNPMRMLSCK